MDARRFKIFGYWTVVSFLSLSLSWVAIDTLVNLDEILAPATSLQSWSLWFSHYLGLFSLHGAQLFGAVALGSAAFGAFVSWRTVKFSSRSMG